MVFNKYIKMKDLRVAFKNYAKRNKDISLYQYFSYYDEEFRSQFKTRSRNN